MVGMHTPFQFACKGSGYEHVMTGVEDTPIRYHSSETSPQVNVVEISLSAAINEYHHLDDGVYLLMPETP
jgi:hypothetical protein